MVVVKNSLEKYSSLRWAVAFFSITFIVSFILFYFPAGGASLVVDMDSKIESFSQVFYGENGVYSEEKSTRVRVSPGRNKLSFPIKGLYSSIRWDPLDVGESITVNDIYVSVFGGRVDVGKILLNPLLDVEKVQATDGNKIVVSMESGASDPQLEIRLDFSEIQRKFTFFCGVLGVATAFLVVGLLLLRDKVNNTLIFIDRSLEHLFYNLRNDGFNSREIGVLTVIGCILYIFFLSSFSLSIDGEAAALRQDPSAWVSQGRWFTYLVEKFVFPQSAIPFAPYVFFVISLSVSYALILRAHGYASDWKAYALYPIFCAFPTWWFISEFVSNVPSLGFGVFFISLSAYLVFREVGSDTLSIRGLVFINAIIVVMLACAIAAYQALLLLFMCVVFGVLLVRCKRSDDVGRILLRYVTIILSKVLLLVLLALILYFSLNFAAQKIIAPDSGYIGQFVKYDAVIKDPIGVTFIVVDQIFSIYSGSSLWYGASIYASGLVILLATLNNISADFIKSAIRLFLWVGVLVTPFALNIISGGEAAPMRVMIALAYVGWLSSTMLLSDKRLSFLLVGGVIVALYQIQIFSVTSQYIAAASIKQSHDRLLAADLYRRIGELGADFDRNASLKIDIYGKKSVNTVYVHGWLSATEGSFFSWDDGNAYRMVNYMKVMGYENISAPDSNERIALTPAFKNMPVWPAAGSVKKNGDHYLVRLSKEPDPVHARFIQ